ncbi:DNA methyltransferase [Marinilactibacillus psychrotolerans]|uniref:site-specific DNA-methyltransferase n=1 Tax=Marinilactibacillus psychrotolerans TaxID=191770 RepID=UPI003886A1DA
MLKDNKQFNESVKSNSAFLNELRHKLPEFFTADKYDGEGNLIEEGKFDNEKFQQSLKEKNIHELSNGYQLDFIGKNYAKKQAGERSTTVIVPDNEYNEKQENKDSKNLFFTGDNLEVLRHLQQNHFNTVDFIYIDPPYNTGSDGFVYPDSFEYSDEQLINMFGLNEEELSRLKSIQGKASHSSWLTFMYPRLYLAKKLLKETGIIFISIDGNEQANLKLIMDDVFGEGSKFPTFIWQNKQGGGNDSIHIAEETEYIYGYAKNLNKVNNWFEKYDDDYIKRYKEIDEKGRFFWDTFKRKSGKQYYSIKTPDGTVLENDEYGNPISWLRSKNRFYKDLEAGEVKFVKNSKGEWNVHFKQRLPQGKKPRNIISNRGTTSTGSSEILALFNANVFSNPKPTTLIKYLIETTTKKDSLILDFFAGSATTADAVMQLNAEDGGNRSYIMAQLPERTKPDSPAYKADYKTIDQISRARIEKAAEKIISENPLLTEKLDFGFKHYQVVEANQLALDKIEYSDEIQLNMFDDMISLFSSDSLGTKGNATGFDTIFQTYLIKDNYKFDVPIKKLDFGGIQIPYVNNQRIYIISKEWSSKNTRDLVNAIGTNEVSVQTVIVYGYTMEMESLRELEIALNQLENKVNLLVRY